MAGIVHKKQKLEAMRLFSGQPNLDSMAYHFTGKSSNFQNASRNWDEGGSSPKGENRRVFEVMLSRASVPLSVDDFFASSYEEFLSRVPSPSLRAAFDPRARADDRVCIFIDPNHHALDPEDAWRRTGIVDQRFMYVSRLAVSDWNKVIEFKHYRTYTLCEDILAKSLLHSSILSDITTVVLLGAGSYSKDRLIVDSLCAAAGPNKKVRFILVDASFYMLIDTYDRLSQYAALTNKECKIEMYCFDFTDVSSWHRNVDFSSTERISVFLLGGTIGNLREREFFDVVRSVFSFGTVFLIAGEFFDSQEAIIDAKGDLLARYRQPSAKDLALTSINDLLNREVVVKSASQRRDFVDVDIIPAEDLHGDLNSSVPGTMSIFFKTRDKIFDRGREFPQLYLVASKRYVKQNFVDVITRRCDVEHIATLDHQKGDAFSHLIFRKLPPT